MKQSVSLAIVAVMTLTTALLTAGPALARHEGHPHATGAPGGRGADLNGSQPPYAGQERGEGARRSALGGQPGRGPAGEYRHLSPEQRQQAFREKQERWQQMSPEQRQQAMQEKKERWQQMSPEQRQQAMARHRERLEKMTPEQRAAHQQRKQEWFNSLPPEQQAAIKQRREQMRANGVHPGQAGQGTPATQPAPAN